MITAKGGSVFSLRTPLLLTLAASSVALLGCGKSGSDPGGGSAAASSSGSGGTIRVVTSTNVYGNIVEAIGGHKVDVTSFISDPAQDPHSYEANVKNQLAVSKASLIIENGGGYDDFVDRMVSSAKSKPTVIDVVEVSGKKAPAGGELNEHVWYDLPTIARLADRIARYLGTADSIDAAAFTRKAAAFKLQLRPLLAREAAIKKADAGKGVAITEPVPLYLLTACGLINETPEKFSAAVEEGDDVPASVLADTLALFSDQKVAALVYNEQTSGPVTEKVKKAADDAHIGVVPVTETLPDGTDYVGWMKSNLDNIQAAVGR